MTQKTKSTLDFPAHPTTSWVIRTLNEEKWLDQVLDMLFTQNRLDFEIVVIDSGSSDATLEIVGRYPVRKLIQIQPEAFGYAAALNAGIEASWGTYIGILSGHSLPTSRTWYHSAMKHFDDDTVAAVTGPYHALPDGSYEEKLGDLTFDLAELSVREVGHMSNTNTIIRKDRWSEYRFDETLPECEDYDWAQEMIARGYTIISEPDFAVLHSHGGLNRPTYHERIGHWKKICTLIDRRTRPRL